VYRPWRFWGICLAFGSGLGFLSTLSGCVGPIALHRAVLEYDQTTAQIQSEMLLLNIARAKNIEPLHFTTVSSVAATFNFETSVGIAPAASATTDLVAPIFQTTVAENPTITIIPVEGEEFAARILSPIHQEKMAHLAGQGITPGLLARLFAEELILLEDGQVRVLHNDPVYKKEYTEFRRRTLHMSSLLKRKNLYKRSLYFEDTLPLLIPLELSEQHALQSQEQILRIKERGYALKQDPDKRGHVLTKRVTGPLFLTNYPLEDLTNEERRQLMLKIGDLPDNTIFVDIRPGFPGGDYPLHGYFLLRSFQEVLQFVALINSTTPEFDVEPDPRTGPVEENPTKVLVIEETVSEPTNATFKVKHGGFWYWLRKPDANMEKKVIWNLQAFRALTQLYELTKVDVSKKPAPAITIAK